MKGIGSRHSERTSLLWLLVEAFAIFSFFMDFNVDFNNPDSMTSVVRDQLPSIETKYAGKG